MVVAGTCGAEFPGSTASAIPGAVDPVSSAVCGTLIGPFGVATLRKVRLSEWIVGKLGSLFVHRTTMLPPLSTTPARPGVNTIRGCEYEAPLGTNPGKG